MSMTERRVKELQLPMEMLLSFQLFSQKSLCIKTSAFKISCLFATEKTTSVPTKDRLQYIKPTEFLNTVHFDKIV